MAAVGRDGAGERSVHIWDNITGPKDGTDSDKPIGNAITHPHHTGLTGQVPGSAEPQIPNTITKTEHNR